MYLGAVPWKHPLKTQSIDHQAIKSRFGIVKSCYCKSTTILTPLTPRCSWLLMAKKSPFSSKTEENPDRCEAKADGLLLDFCRFIRLQAAQDAWLRRLTRQHTMALLGRGFFLFWVVFFGHVFWARFLMFLRCFWDVFWDILFGCLFECFGMFGVGLN